MIYDYPTLIVDSFFKHPLDIRNFALGLDYKPSNIGTYSGVRTDPLHLTHPTFHKNVCSKILDCYNIPYEDYAATVHFHLTGEEAGDIGWIHTDAGRNYAPGFASIVYLNPDNNDGVGGTNLYKLANNDWDNRNIPLMKRAFIDNIDNVSAKTEHNQNYINTVVIGNLFNRMIAYDTRTPHTGSNYYGNCKQTSRLTLLAFFHNVITVDNYTPLRRVNNYSNI